MAVLSFLDRDHSVAKPGFSRWLVPPAALAIHLSIGQAYGFSAFKIPLTELLGVRESLPQDWKQTEVAWICSLAWRLVGVPLGWGVYHRLLSSTKPFQTPPATQHTWHLIAGIA